MASNLHIRDCQDTAPAAHAKAPPMLAAVRGTAGSGILRQVASPERLVGAVTLLVLTVLLLAAIIGVAEAQVRKGADFRYPQPAGSAQPAPP